MTPTERAIAALPAHLRRFVVAQDYGAYTPRDQAVWRHVLRQLRAHLADTAHSVYLEGLEATGIDTERIPSLDDMNDKLAKLGWSAVAVRGFIPPAVFTELQARGVLAIAADIRTHEHIAYTPAPDIIHESAGHAPILANARSDVLVDHCQKSNAGLYYADRDEFTECLRLLIANHRLRATMGRNGRDYVKRNYRWDVILQKYEKMFARLRQAPKR